MKNAIKNFLAGAGSVFELLPPQKGTALHQWSLAGSDADRIRGDWERVGNNLQSATEKVTRGVEPHADAE